MWGSRVDRPVSKHLRSWRTLKSLHIAQLCLEFKEVLWTSSWSTHGHENTPRSSATVVKKKGPSPWESTSICSFNFPTSYVHFVVALIFLPFIEGSNQCWVVLWFCTKPLLDTKFERPTPQAPTQENIKDVQELTKNQWFFEGFEIPGSGSSFLLIFFQRTIQPWLKLSPLTSLISKGIIQATIIPENCSN